MFEYDVKELLFNNNNNILSGIAEQLNDLSKEIKSDILIKRITDIISLLNKAINENNKNFQMLTYMMGKMNLKFDQIVNYLPKYGAKIYPEGMYEGEMVNNKREGKGKFTYLNNERFLGKVYTGDWKNDMREGKGMEVWPDGEKFEGNFKNDKREGKGIYYYQNGERHEGEYKNGKKEGLGIYFYNNGDIKFCHYYNNNPVGKIVLMTANRDIKIIESSS